MKIGRRSAVAGLAALAVAAAATGCSTKAKNDTGSGSSSGGTAAGSVKTGRGVTADTITIAELTDLTGIFAALGKNITQANQMYWDQKNAAGGVCGRKVNLIVKDHGYNVQTAVSLYGQVHDQVLAIEQLIGSPIVTALSPQILQDKMLTAPAAWATSLLQNPFVQITGATYAVEMINGVDYLVKNKGLKSGDKLGVIYQDSEYGADGVGCLGGQGERAERADHRQQPGLRPVAADHAVEGRAGRALLPGAVRRAVLRARGQGRGGAVQAEVPERDSQLRRALWLRGGRQLLPDPGQGVQGR